MFLCIILNSAEGQLLNRGTRYVIHAVAPHPNDTDFEGTLADAVFNTMKEAEHLKVKSLAFPAIGSGM